MINSKRVLDHPAFLLHHRPFRDSSQILEVFSHEHGRLAVVARGSRAGKSRYRGILRPFLALRLSWVIRSDLGTLTGAEIAGAPLVLTGKALLSGYYVNELLLNLLHKHDPQPEVFALYEETIRALAAGRNLSATLRRFEGRLLDLIGYGLNLDCDAVSGELVKADRHYHYRVEQGPVETHDSGQPQAFSGSSLQAIAAGQFDDAEVLRAAGLLFREVLAYHLNGRELKSRKVLMDLQRNLKKD